MTYRSSTVLALGVSLFAIPAAAIAQDSSGSAARDAAQPADGGIQDIVVTANRVESQSQRTATALTVYTGADLAAKGVTNVQSLAAVDPSISMVSSNGGAYVAVRGIASTDLTEIGDPAVPITRDGFYTNRSYSIQATMYDLARIEVLKGPQGTLNGRNSTGGLISVITVRPKPENGGYIDLGVGNYGAFHSEAAANLALTDTIAVRASGVFDYHKGYRRITGLYTGQAQRGDDANVASGRIQIAWNPTPDLHLWASYQHDSVIGVGDVSMNTALGVRPDFGDAKTFSNGAPTSVSLRGDRVRWEVRHDALPGGLNFIYAGGYDVQTWKHVLDATMPPGNYPAYRQFIQQEHPKTWNHEVRIANDAGARLNFQVGWFHFQEKNAVSTGLENVAMQGAFAPGGPLAAFSQTGVQGLLFDYPSVSALSDAVFGYLNFRVNDQFKLSAGIRETWDSKARVGNTTLVLPALVHPMCAVGFPAPGTCPPFPLVTPSGGKSNQSQLTYHVGLDWTPNDTTLVYVKYDTGYKGGGFNSNGLSASVPYGPEKVGAVEIGSKNRFFDNKIQLNVDAFYMRYTGYQGSQFLSLLGGGVGVFNVGSANIYGAEAQLIALFGTGGRFDLNATALRTKFGAGETIVDGAGNLVPIGGKRLPNAPSLAISAGLEQAIPIAGGHLTGRIDGKYSSSYYFSVFNNPDEQSRDYLVANASLTYKPDGGNWEIQAYVRNLTDKVVLSLAQRNYNAAENNYEFQAPRTFGVRGRVTF